MNDITKYIVPTSFNIKEAVKQIDKGGIGFCVCVDNEDKVIGVISDGDFRRAVLKGENLNSGVENIINKNFIYVANTWRRKELEDIFLNSAVQHIPVIKDGELVDIITKEKFFGVERENNLPTIVSPVVIMAGGKGKRMDPFTRILPKPLIPVGDNPVIKVIMDEFAKYGIKDFHITLNDKGRMIKAYFHEHDLPYSIKYIEEVKPLGTAGALRYLDGKSDVPLFITNCDIIIHTDYSAILEYHVQNDYDLTLVASMRHYQIPYGVCDVGDEGELLNIHEKPEYDLLVNTGLYVIEPSILKMIPDNTYFDMPDLIKEIQRQNKKVGVFPVSEKSWNDVGQWPEYHESLGNLLM